MSVPDDWMLCYDCSILHIGGLCEQVHQRLAIRVREGLTDDVCTGNTGRNRCITVLHADGGTLNSVPCRVQTYKKAISLPVSKEHSQLN
jgi:hypothetical protein